MVDESENRTARLLFKLAMEMSMMMNILAANVDVDETTLEKLRGKCVQDDVDYALNNYQKLL